MNKKANILLAILGVACVGVIGYQVKNGPLVNWTHSADSQDDGVIHFGDTVGTSEIESEVSEPDSNDPNCGSVIVLDSNDLHRISTYTGDVWTSETEGESFVAIAESLTIGSSVALAKSLTICVDGGNTVEMTWENGILDIKGDPNLYTPAAKVFLECAMRYAAVDIVAGDKALIRKLCTSGKVCEVIGHQWNYPDGFIWEDDTKRPTVRARECPICGKREQSVRQPEWSEWKVEGVTK